MCTIPTCEEEAEILLVFSVLIIIIIQPVLVVTHYWDCARFPHPLTIHTFHNDYDLIRRATSSLLDRLEKENKLVAAQCIWWLASIIQFMEILSYYRQYKIFQVKYQIRDCKVSLLDKDTAVPLIVQDDISEVDLDDGFDSSNTHPHRIQKLPVPSTVATRKFVKSQTIVKNTPICRLQNTVHRNINPHNSHSYEELETHLGC